MTTYIAKFTTCGDGWWSRVAKPVRITHITMHPSMGIDEMRVWFETADWNVAVDGLIYTDSQWLAELREELQTQGLPAQDVDYSEQGMQGDSYVSLDIGRNFTNQFHAKLLKGELIQYVTSLENIFKK